jgi:hypothetical protein
MIVLTPIYLCLKPKSKELKKFNTFVTQMFYFPIFLMLLSIFIAANLILIPFAYVVAIVNKVRLIRKFNHI